MEVEPQNDSRKRPRTPGPSYEEVNSNHIWCKQCGKTYPWPPGSKEEARLYRVFLLDEQKKSFFCDADCYWWFREADNPKTNQTRAVERQKDEEGEGWGRPVPQDQDKHYLSLYGLDGFGSAIDWSAKLVRPRTQESQESDGISTVEPEPVAMEETVPE